MHYTFNRLGQWGALGNQLWEIAGTYGEAVRKGRVPAFPVDWFYRPYFNVPDRLFPAHLIDPEDAGENYFQDQSYFEPWHGLIFRMFSPTPMVQDALEFAYGDELYGKTAVHVRRGNNATPQYASHHPVPSLDYYEEAMDRLGGPFRIITDSPEWCREQSLFKDHEFAVGPPPGIDVMTLTNGTPLGTVEAALDLHTISKSQKIVMSNSSFSWWGAWLAGSGASVVYPARWYGDPLAHIDTSVMFNRNWAKDWVKL